MKFIELNRSFIPIGYSEEPHLDIGRVFGHKIAGWLEWPDLHKHWRVVLLAEASSGKSAEFRNQVDKLTTAGYPAFFVRIEELADQGFEAALELDAARKFEQWRSGTGEAWFFLDSVDEARLNRKNFESALKRFARELDQSLERARVFISCRVSDWKGAEDRAAMERMLPSWESPTTVPVSPDETDALLDPIFESKRNGQASQANRVDQRPHELLLLKLVPLSIAQCQKLAQAAGVNNITGFMDNIARNGLHAFAERPGDLLELVDYWNSQQRFGSLAEMVKHFTTRHFFQHGKVTLGAG